MDMLRGRHNFTSALSFPLQCLGLPGFLTEVLPLLWRFSGAPGLDPSADSMRMYGFSCPGDHCSCLVFIISTL